MSQHRYEQNTDPSTSLENSTYNIISSLNSEAKFLYKTVDTYIEDARRENRPDIEDVWKLSKRTRKDISRY